MNVAWRWKNFLMRRDEPAKRKISWSSCRKQSTGFRSPFNSWEVRPWLDYRRGGRRSERNCDLFSGRGAIRLRHALDNAVFLPSDGSHSGNQRANRSRDRNRNRRQYSTTFSKTLFVWNRFPSIDCEYFQYRSGHWSHGSGGGIDFSRSDSTFRYSRWKYFFSAASSDSLF